MIKEIRVGQVGHQFMGVAHSNAFRNAGIWYDLPCKIVMKAVCAKDSEENLAAFAEKFGWESHVADWRKLVARDDEPITAYVDRVRELYDELGVSTVLIMGGSGDYFDVANRVIHMVAYLPEDVTGDAAIVATDLPTFRSAEAATPLAPPRERHPLPDGLVEQNEYGYWRIYASRTDRLIYGSTEVDLGGIDQLVEPSQTKAIGLAMEYAKEYKDGNRTLRKVIDRVRADMDRHGLDLLDRRGIGDIIEFRSVDLAAVINRFRGMTFT